MKRDENIEKLVCESTVRLDESVDREILDEALSCLGGVREGARVDAQAGTRRTIMRGPIPHLAVAAVIAVAVVLGLINLGAPGKGAGVVYAAAMDRVRQARTFSCVESFEMPYQNGEERGRYVLKQKLMFKEPDRERREQLTAAPPWPRDAGKVTIWHYGKRQRLEYWPFDKTAEFHDMNSDYVVDDETGELELSQLDTRIRDSLLKVSAGAVEDLGEAELDGQSVRLLRSQKGERITTVWVDPKTNYPVQLEQKWTDPKRGPVMFASIEIGSELDAALFRLEPPEGYTLRADRPDWPDDKMKVMTKAKYLGLWCVIYANDHDDQFPDALADLVTAGVITETVLRNILADPDDPSGQPVLRYRKPNTVGRDWGSEVILHEVYNPWPDDGVVACFADGHCERIIDHSRFEELVR
jgi:outer membrane lipoprotein-sorting protein